MARPSRSFFRFGGIRASREKKMFHNGEGGGESVPASLPVLFNTFLSARGKRHGRRKKNWGILTRFLD